MKKNVYFSHDGSIDDFVALMCFLAEDSINIIGIGVINADCYIESGVSVTRKMVDVFSRYDIEVASSTARAVNQFPRHWREESYRIDAFPILNDLDEVKAPHVDEPAHLHMVRKIRESKTNVDIFAVGPLTDVAEAFKAAPDIIDKVDRLVWMGGSFTGEGNVNQPDHDASAEWNAFWDPHAVKDVFDSGVPMALAGLNATDQCPWTEEMHTEWVSLKRYEAVDFTGQLYASIVHLAKVTQDGQYYFWDTLAAVHYLNPEITSTRDVVVKVHTKGRGQGFIEEVEDGRVITIIDKVDVNDVFQYVKKLMMSFGLNKYMK